MAEPHEVVHAGRRARAAFEFRDAQGGALDRYEVHARSLPGA